MVNKKIKDSPTDFMKPRRNLFPKLKDVLASYQSPSAAGYPDWTKKDDKIQIFGMPGRIYVLSTHIYQIIATGFVADYGMASASCGSSSRLPCMPRFGRS